MRVEITITGSVSDDPVGLIKDVLYVAIEGGLTAAAAEFSYGRQEGLRLAPDADQAQRLLEHAIQVDARRKNEEAQAQQEPEASVDEGAQSDTEDEGGEAGAATQDGQAAVLDVSFGSVAAAKLADELDLVKDDFRWKRKSGKRGFTVGDVRAIAAAR